MNKKYLPFLLMIAISFMNLGCNSKSPNHDTVINAASSESPQDTSTKPREENSFDYPDEVKIGEQLWMTHNLNVDTFNNGDKIFYASNADEWNNAGDKKKPAYCYYKFDSKYGILFGKLYNWYSVNDKRGLAPQGWHISSDKEWLVAFENILNNTDESQQIKYTYGWGTFSEDIPCENCLNWNKEYRSKVPCNVCRDSRVNGQKEISFSGSNTTGFCALPSSQFGRIFEFGQLDEAWWWTSTKSSSNYAIAYGLEYSVQSSYDKDGKVLRLAHSASTLEREDEPKNYGFSVRCIKN